MINRITLAITGASGAQYALRLLRALVAADVRVSLLVSRAAEVVIRTETSLILPEVFDEQQLFWRQYAEATAENLTLFFWFLVISQYSHLCTGLDTRLESGIYVDMGCYNKLSLYRKQVQNTKVTGFMSVSESVR